MRRPDADLAGAEIRKRAVGQTHSQGIIPVQIQNMRLYGLCSGTKDADVPPNQERALPIGLKNSGIIRSERILIKTVEHAGGQPAADVRDLFPVQDGPGDPGDLRRKSALMP